MIDIAVHDLNKYYGSNHVIKSMTFEVNSGERVGLLGKNGSGKTTLFKVISGDEYYESGNISKATGKKIEVLAQIPTFGENDTVEDILRTSFKELANIFKEMKKIEGSETPSDLEKYCQLIEEYEQIGGYDIDYKIDKICGGMKIDQRMRESDFKKLSGGEKTRVNLARILLRDCDILLLDEPTNHLDLDSLEWLEKFLHNFKGTIVVISHDRIFLDNIVNRIIEIEDGKANFYSGNYSFYVIERQQRISLQAEQYERQQKEIKRIEDRAKWFVLQNQFTTKHHAILSRIDHMDKVDKPTVARKLTSGFDSGEYSTKEIVSLDCVCKQYETKVILDQLSLKILKNEKIALVGANGSGKTTIIKMIMNEEICDSGEIKISPSVKPLYMQQIIAFENNYHSILDTLRFATDLSEEKSISILNRFNFSFQDLTKKVGNLSGGEKSRLKLCLMMQTSANFLLLDEPTNHLDIDSRQWIENALDDFDGTMLFISHDRYFLRKFATKIWQLENGLIKEFDCGFDEYLEIISNTSSKEKPVFKKKTKKTHPLKITTAKADLNPKASMETAISTIEDEISEINLEIKSELEIGNYSKMDQLYETKSQLEKQLDLLYSEWIGGGE